MSNHLHSSKEKQLSQLGHVIVIKVKEGEQSMQLLNGRSCLCLETLFLLPLFHWLCNTFSIYPIIHAHSLTKGENWGRAGHEVEFCFMVPKPVLKKNPCKKSAKLSKDHVRGLKSNFLLSWVFIFLSINIAFWFMVSSAFSPVTTYGYCKETWKISQKSGFGLILSRICEMSELGDRP